MIFINSKKILDCDENEEEKHNEEISRFLDNLYAISRQKSTICCDRAL